MVKDVGLHFRRATGQRITVIRPSNIEKARSRASLVIIAHVIRNHDVIPAELRQRLRIADREAGRKCHCRAGDAANAPVVFKQVVFDRVLLATVIKDPYSVAGRRNHYIREPLVGSGSVVVYLGPGAPRGAAIPGLDEKDVRLVRGASCDFIVVGAIHIAAHRVHRNVWEPVAAEVCGHAAVHYACKAEVAVGAASANERDCRDGRSKGQALVG